MRRMCSHVHFALKTCSFFSLSFGPRTVTRFEKRLTADCAGKCQLCTCNALLVLSAHGDVKTLISRISPAPAPTTDIHTNDIGKCALVCRVANITDELTPARRVSEWWIKKAWNIIKSPRRLWETHNRIRIPIHNWMWGWILPIVSCTHKSDSNAYLTAIQLHR